MKLISKIFLSITLVTFLCSCAAPVLVAGGATGGYYIGKHRHAVGQYTSDTWITSKIKSKYVKDLKLKSFTLSVSTNHGVVSLVGTVPSKAIRNRAILIAKHTKGVRAVEANNLTISSKPKKS
jgi:osmotically-inducible protein OsmY